MKIKISISFLFFFQILIWKFFIYFLLLILCLFTIPEKILNANLNLGRLVEYINNSCIFHNIILRIFIWITKVCSVLVRSSCQGLYSASSKAHCYPSQKETNKTQATWFFLIVTIFLHCSWNFFYNWIIFIWLMRIIILFYFNPNL